MTKLVQRGLTSRNETEMELFADRVSEYNKSKGFVVLNAEAQEKSDGHWDWELEFASRAYAKDFWTDPKYQTNIKRAKEEDVTYEL